MMLRHALTTQQKQQLRLQARSAKPAVMVSPPPVVHQRQTCPATLTAPAKPSDLASTDIAKLLVARGAAYKEAQSACGHFKATVVSKVARQLSECFQVKVNNSDVQPYLDRARNPPLRVFIKEDERLGKGAMGKVYAAPDVVCEQLKNEAAAIKVADLTLTNLLQCDAWSSGGELEALVLRHMGLLTSKAIPVAWDLRPYSHVTEDGQVTAGAKLYLLMKKFDMNWRDFIKAYHQYHSHQEGGRHVDIRTHVLALAQINDQLGELHVLKYSHCDVKPENVLVTVDPETGEIKDVAVADFGTLTGRGNTATAPVACGTWVVERDSQGHYLASVRADTYNIGKMLLESLLGTHVASGCTQALCFHLTSIGWVPTVTAEMLTKAATHERFTRQGPPASADHWESKLPVLDPVARLLGPEFSVGMTGDGGRLAAERITSLFSPGQQEACVIQVMGVLMTLTYQLMTLQEVPGTVISEALRSTAQHLDQEVAAKGDARHGLLNVMDDMFPVHDQGWVALRQEALQRGAAPLTVGLAAFRQLQHQQQQQQVQDLIQQYQIAAGLHPLVPIPVPVKQQQQQQQAAHFILLPQQPSLSQEGSSTQQGDVLSDSDWSIAEGGSHVSSAGHTQSSGSSGSQQAPSPALTLADSVTLDLQAGSHIVSSALQVLGEDESPHQQPQDHHLLLQQLAGLSAEEKEVLLVKAGWEVYEGCYVFAPDGQLVQTLEQPLPREVVDILLQAHQ